MCTLQTGIVSVEMRSTVVRITQTDRVSSWGALSATFYSATCIVLYTHRCNWLDYRKISMRCPVSHTCDADVGGTYYQQTLTTTDVVDDTAYPVANAPSWTRTTVADGHKFSAVRRLSQIILDRPKGAISTYPISVDALVAGDPIEISLKNYWQKKTRIPELLRGVAWSYV